MVPPPWSCPSRMPGIVVTDQPIRPDTRMDGQHPFPMTRSSTLDRSRGSSRLTAGASYEGRRMRSAGDQGGHEGIVPAGVFAFALQAGLQRAVGPGKVQRNPAQQGQVPGRVPLPHPAGVLAEGDVENPMKPVLDPPVVPTTA